MTQEEKDLFFMQEALMEAYTAAELDEVPVGAVMVFEDTVIAFPLLADGQVSPITGPWVMMKALRSGYMNGAGMDGEYLQLSLDDSYGENALRVNVWLDDSDRPVNADIYWNERRVLSIKVADFRFL